MQTPKVPFNVPCLTGKELFYMGQTHAAKTLAGESVFSARCGRWLEEKLSSPKVLLTHSCTAALEMCALLADIRPGDEVIIPSYTFPSAANAFALREGIPVFVDIRPDTFNLNEQLIEAAVTPRTRAIAAVHYAGTACEMDTVMAIAARHKLMVIEDAAHALLAAYKGRPLGSIGHLGCISFHETKNITSGRGGALLINDARLIKRAEIIREAGTNRAEFLKNLAPDYRWQDLGSSYVMGETSAAFLWAQLEEAESITARRLAVWRNYHRGLQGMEDAGWIRRPVIPPACEPNGHAYPILVRSETQRARLIARLKERGIQAAFHYLPLHSSPAGQRFGKVSGRLPVTDDTAARILRLPLWPGLETGDVLPALIEAITAENRDPA